MTSTTPTPLIVTSDLGAHRARLRRTDVRAGSSFGGARATQEYFPQTHTYSLPVVREMPPHQARFIATW